MGAAICAACKALLVRLAPPLCARCGAPGAWPVGRCAECAGRRIAFASARAAILYDERARRLISDWKERGQRRLAEEAATIVAEVLVRPDVAALTFVPAQRERTLKRGHRPAEALARGLGRRWGLPVEALVGRTRAVERQRGLGLKERRQNVAGAFAPARALADHRLSRRRHLHERGHSGGGGDRAPEGRCAPGRSGHARAGSSLTGSAATRYSLGTTGREETHATSGQRPECRGQRFDPEVCRGEARQARAAARRSDTGGARARPRAQPVHRRGPHRRGDDLDEGTDTARARELGGVRGVDRPAREQARAAGRSGTARSAADARRRGERTDRFRRSRSSRPSSWSR